MSNLDLLLIGLISSYSNIRIIASLSFHTALRPMNEEIRSIRKNRWLQHKAQPKDGDHSFTDQTMNIATSNLIDLSNIGDYNEPMDTEEGSMMKGSESSQLFSSDHDDECEVIGVKPGATTSRTGKEFEKNKVTTPDDFHPNFSICSYNVWFGEPYPAERMQHIASLILSFPPKPLFLGFQEVTALLRTALFPLLEYSGYRMICQPNIEYDGYGCAIGVLHGNPNAPKEDTLKVDVVKHGFHDYRDTIMNRGLLWTHAKIRTRDGNACKNVFFSTTHLESFMRNYPSFGQTYEGASQRLSQIQQASQFSLQYMERWNTEQSKDRIQMAFITGDLNWDDERKRAQGADANLLSTINGGGKNTWADAWIETNQGLDGYTYDAKENPMLGGNLRRRFDRCLVHQNPSRVIRGAHLIGTKAIHGLIWKKEVQKWNGQGLSGTGQYKSCPVLPSDHYGLLVDIGEPCITTSSDDD